jgi:hypothetical protein
VVIKQLYYGLKEVQGRSRDNAYSRQIAHPLDLYKLDLQTSLFKMTMKAHAAKSIEPPLDKNPTGKLWQKLGCNALLLSKLSEFMKILEIVVTVVLGSYEDEKFFSNLAFMKNKV